MLLRSATKKSHEPDGGTPTEVPERGHTKQGVSSTDVILYLPNIVGYLRLVCMILAFVNSTRNWRMSVFFYIMAFVGDVVDGYVARAFDQCMLCIYIY